MSHFLAHVFILEKGQRMYCPKIQNINDEHNRPKIYKQDIELLHPAGQCQFWQSIYLSIYLSISFYSHLYQSVHIYLSIYLSQSVLINLSVL